MEAQILERLMLEIDRRIESKSDALVRGHGIEDMSAYRARVAEITLLNALKDYVVEQEAQLLHT